MAKQRIVNTHFWKDNYVMELDPSEKLLFLYFITNPETDLCGIYEKSVREIAFDTGFDKSMVEKIIARFEREGKIFYKNGYVYIRNFVKHQMTNPKIEQGIKRSMENLPKEIIAWVSQIDSLSIDYDSLSHSNLNSNSNSNSNLSDTRKREKKSEKDLIFDFLNVAESENAISHELGEKIREFVSFRISIKKTMKASSFKDWTSELMELSGSNEETAIRILTKSIANGWQGIFPIDGRNSAKTKNISSF